MEQQRASFYKQRVQYLIAALFLFRCAVAFCIELGNDEAYYWLYNQGLAWNYFDHPPVVALWTRIFTLNNLLPDHEVILRLGSIAGCGISSWFMYQTVLTLHSARAAFFAACLYNASFYAGLTAGVYLMPDAPQMVFWTLSLLMAARLTNGATNWSSWILFGVAAGLAIMSKVHGVFIWGGMALYVVCFKRAWLLKPQVYVAAVVTLVLISPILVWNLEYDFITYRFHSQRVTITEGSKGTNYMREFAGQILFNNPVNVILALCGLIQLARYKAARIPALALYNFMALPLAGILLFVSFFRDTTLPHWSGPAYVSLIPLGAITVAQIKKPAVFKRLHWVSLGLFILVLTAWCGIVNYYPGTTGSKEKMNLGRNDISLDVFGWKQAAEHFSTIYKNDVEVGLAVPGTPLVSAYWWGAHVEYYFARPLQLPMVGLGPVQQVRHYLWTNASLQGINMQTAYCVMPVDEQYELPHQYYSGINLTHLISVKRNGQPAHDFRVYRLTGWKGVLPFIR